MRHALAALLVLVSVHGTAAMSVDAAYQAIPHRRTVFDRSAATMSAEQTAYLERLFELIDAAIVARVTRTGGDDVTVRLAALEAPPPLRRLHALVREAVAAEQAYLRGAADGAGVGADPLVRSASARLHEAYAELMRLFPQEGAHNRDAFYDYLCALDFL